MHVYIVFSILIFKLFKSIELIWAIPHSLRLKLCGFITTYFQPHFVLKHSPYFLQRTHFLDLIRLWALNLIKLFILSTFPTWMCILYNKKKKMRSNQSDCLYYWNVYNFQITKSYRSIYQIYKLELVNIGSRRTVYNIDLAIKWCYNSIIIL